jgi:urease gamma subunit
MNLTPREKDKLMIALAALDARTVGVMPYAI